MFILLHHEVLKAAITISDLVSSTYFCVWYYKALCSCNTVLVNGVIFVLSCYWTCEVISFNINSTIGVLNHRFVLLFLQFWLTCCFLILLHWQCLFSVQWGIWMAMNVWMWINWWHIVCLPCMTEVELNKPEGNFYILGLCFPTRVLQNIIRGSARNYGINK
jgi:hypothetical protein